MIGRQQHVDPMLQDHRKNRKNWRERAEATRARAGQMTNPRSRRVLLSIAETYDVMDRQSAARGRESDHARSSERSYRFAATSAIASAATARRGYLFVRLWLGLVRSDFKLAGRDAKS
jgi:hypothetical protein